MVMTVRFTHFLSHTPRTVSGMYGFDTSAITLYASCGLSDGTTFTRSAVVLSLAKPASICKPEQVASVATGKEVVNLSLMIAQW